MIYGAAFRQRLADEVIIQMALQDYNTEYWRLESLSRPHKMAHADPKLSIHQVRYQGRFVDDATGVVYDVSINYDALTGDFGTIKEASGK